MWGSVKYWVLCGSSPFSSPLPYPSAVTQPSSHLHHSYWPFSKPLQLSLCAPLMPFFSPPHLSLLLPSYCPSPSVQLLFHSLLALQLDTSAVPPCVDPLQPSA